MDKGINGKQGQRLTSLLLMQRSPVKSNLHAFNQTSSDLAGLTIFISTPYTTKHRFFMFLDAMFLSADMLVSFAFDDTYSLGIISRCVHVVWAIASGGRMEICNAPLYNNDICSESFPFPLVSQAQWEHIRALEE